MRPISNRKLSRNLPNTDVRELHYWFAPTSGSPSFLCVCAICSDPVELTANNHATFPVSVLWRLRDYLRLLWGARFVSLVILPTFSLSVYLYICVWLCFYLSFCWFFFCQLLHSPRHLVLVFLKSYFLWKAKLNLVNNLLLFHLGW